MASESAFSHLYKSRTTHDKDVRQSERRFQLLDYQKAKRNQLIDSNRDIEPLKRIFKKSSHSKQSKLYKNHIQLSEWMLEKPNDIDQWYLRPCPKGIRCLVVATDGKTEVFNKRGVCMKKFRSLLPGNFRNSRDSMTVLDCVFVAALNEYFVLDVLAYGNQDLTNCEAAFRFYWIGSRIEEDRLDVVTAQNQFAFHMIENCECDDEIALNTLLSQYPLWPNNCPKLDGFLFYHKDSSYVYGKTPLVGWLFSFMIPELFAVPALNENYMNDKPPNYINYLTYIKDFDEAQRAKHKRRTKARPEQMEEESNENSASNTIESVMRNAEEMETESTVNDSDGDNLKLVEENHMIVELEKHFELPKMTCSLTQ